MNPASPQILVLDPHPVVAAGIESHLTRVLPGMNLSATHDFPSAFTRLEHHPVDLIITDFQAGEDTVLSLLATLHTRQIPSRCLVFSALDEIHHGLPCIRAGAAGFLTKHAPLDDLVDAVHALLNGRTWLSERLTHALAAGSANGTPPAINLSRREQEIFTYFGQGLSVSKIAARLGLSVKTIEAHREHIKTKLGLQTAAQVTATASRWIHDFSI